MPSLRAPFRHPMFRRYFAGQAISQVGDFVFFVALPWQVLVLTGSAADLGGVASTYFAAQLILLLAGGVLTDRVPRRTLVVLSDMLQGVLVGAVAVFAGTSTITIGHMYVFGALFGAAQAFAMPALGAFLPETVPKADLQAANTLYQGTRTLALIGGPALGALLIALGGTTAAFAFDAISFAVSAALLWSARGGASTPRPRERKPSVLVQVREGWRYTARVPWLWITILVFAIVNAAEAGPRGVVLPAFVALDLRGGPTAIGLVLSTMAAGSLLGFFLPNFLPPIRHRGLIAYVATALFGVSIALMAFSPNLIGILGLGFLHGVAVAVFSLMWQTAMMEQVREDIRGRVFSLDELGSFLLLPFSFFACGVLAVLLGPRVVLLGGGLIVMLCAAAGLLYPPAHRFEGPAPRASR